MLAIAGAGISEGDLIRPKGVGDIARYPIMVPADADWAGPLYLAQETRRSGSKLHFTRYGHVLNAEVSGLGPHVLEDTVVFLADGGKLSTEGKRPVGCLAPHPDKGPIAHIEPGGCVVAPWFVQSSDDDTRLTDLETTVAELLTARKRTRKRKSPEE